MKNNTVINVLQIFESYPVFYQPYIPPVVDALLERNDITLTVDVYKGQSGGKVTKMPSYSYRRVYETFYHWLRPSPKKLNYLEIQSLRQKVDVLHIQDSFLHRKAYGLLDRPLDKRPKIVITLRGSDTYVKPWVMARWKDFYMTYGPKVDAFVVMSTHQKQYLNSKWGIANEKIHVIPISLNINKAQKPKQCDANTINIASAFRMCWEKNIEGNLYVIKLLKDKGLNVRYDLYGDGPDAGQVHYLIDKYDLQDCVTYHGRVDHARLKENLSRSDFYLQLSHSESLGMSVIEAQALGLPAVVTDSGGLPEVILSGESGFTVTPNQYLKAAELIEQLWRNHDQYLAFSKAAITFSDQHFKVENEVNQLISLYKSLV